MKTPVFSRMAIVACSVVLLAGCQSTSVPVSNTKAPAEPVFLKIDGSSTVYPITEAVAEDFRSVAPHVKVTVGVSGTGGGFKKFCRGEIDISDASRPIKKDEAAVCDEQKIQYVELPVAYDGLAVVVNPKNDWVTSMTVAELKKLWEPDAQGKITKWSQIRAGWPDKEIHLFGAGTESGTYDYFTEAIVGKAKSSRGDFTASEDDNTLVQGISSDTYALGFFGLAYYEENQGRLKLVPIDDEKDENGKGPIAPSLETVKNTTYQPLSRPLFVYVSKQSLAKKEVVQFVDYYLKNASRLSQEVGYIPLSDAIMALVRVRFDDRKIGTMFTGSDIGVHLEDLLQR